MNNWKQVKGLYEKRASHHKENKDNVTGERGTLGSKWGGGAWIPKHVLINVHQCLRNWSSKWKVHADTSWFKNNTASYTYIYFVRIEAILRSYFYNEEVPGKLGNIVAETFEVNWCKILLKWCSIIFRGILAHCLVCLKHVGKLGNIASGLICPISNLPRALERNFHDILSLHWFFPPYIYGEAPLISVNFFPNVTMPSSCHYQSQAFNALIC
jgi:hypothetical protein